MPTVTNFAFLLLKKRNLCLPWVCKSGSGGNLLETKKTLKKHVNPTLADTLKKRALDTLNMDGVIPPTEENAMSHAATHKHHHVPVSIIITLVIAIVVIGALIAIPYITSPKTAIIPVTGQQNAYAEYIIGEKTIYAMPFGVNRAMTTYRSGEKTIYHVSNLNTALSSYRLGEKYVMSASEYALLVHRMGEKDY